MAILYTRFEEVKIRLIGKVKFTANEEDQNNFQIRLANRLISEAEGQVEIDLSPRYSAPFVTDAGDAFGSLPDRPTKEIIRTLCELKSVIRILETDYGSGSTVDASKYSEEITKRYNDILGKLVERFQINGEPTHQWAYPPLPGLQLAPHNDQGDDGYAGQILVTSMGDGDFPSRQINNPAENFFSATVDDTDKTQTDRPFGGK